MNLYNENDPKTAAWLRELIIEEHIGRGAVLERSIWDLDPRDLGEYPQCHFFAGIGGWPLALRLAGWPDDEPVWTGSCPCQPFSQAGARKVDQDERHLWPAFREAIAFCQPAVVFGEQVASPDGRVWLAGVRADLEELGYAVGAADLCAAGVGAPHIRQRLFWVADSRQQQTRLRILGSRESIEATGVRTSDQPGGSSCIGGLGHTNGAGQQKRAGVRGDDGEAQQSTTGQAAEQGSAWSDFDVLPFQDGKFRRVESGSFPLAHGVPGRVGLLRGYGNAIVPQLAAEFIKAFLETF